MEKGHYVLVVDDLSSGKKENLPLHHNNLQFIHGDIRDRVLIKYLRRTFPEITYIFHLAAIASVVRSMEEPLASHEINYLGTLYLLEEFRNIPLKKFVYASSAAVYGSPPNLPIDENVAPGPLSLYGLDKLACEHLLKIFHTSFGIPTLCCRFFNVFGERQDPCSMYSGVISIFINRAFSQKKGENTPIVIYGDGKQTRDFIYVKDLVSALIYLAESEDIQGEIFNLGYGAQISILQLVDFLSNAVGRSLEVLFNNYRIGDISHSQANIQKIKNTGFAYNYDFNSGLKHMVDSMLKENGYQ